MEKNIRVRTAERIAELFNLHGIRYVVCNGLYYYPQNIGRDLDIIIHPEDVPLAVYLLKKVQKEFEWDFFFIRWSYHGVWQVYFVLVNSNIIKWLEVDLMCHNVNLVLGLSSLISTSIVEDNDLLFRGPFRISPIGEYFKGYFRPIYYGDINRFKYRYSLKAPDTSEVSNALRNWLGKTLFEEYIQKISGSLDELQRWSRSLKWRLNLRYAFHYPLVAFRNFLWTRLLRPLLLYFFNPGMIIAVVGPDGVGKSTSIREAIRYLNGLFDIKVRHWRPGLLPTPGTFLGRAKKSENVSPSPNRKAPYQIEHWIRIIYYWLDYFLGYFIKDRFLPKSVIQLVIYDRHAVDTAVDPLRYRLRSEKGTSFLYRFTPRPHCIILLLDKPEKIVERKQELSIQEIEHQFAKWEELRHKGWIDAVIRVGDSPQETGKRIVDQILDLAQQHFDLRKSSLWKKIFKHYGFKSVWINGVCRVAWPARYNLNRFAQTLYHPYRRIEAWFYRLWWQFPVRLGSRLKIKYSENPPRIPFQWQKCLLEIERLLGKKDLNPVFYFPPQPERGKAGILLVQGASKAVAFVKIAWDDASKAEIERETIALRFLDDLQPENFAYSEILHHGENEEYRYAIYSPITNAQPAPKNWCTLYKKAWEELVNKTGHKVLLDEAIKSLKKNISNRLWNDIDFFLQKITEKNNKVLYCAVHGDLAPWNACLVNGQLFLFDWEEFSISAPFLLDVVHFEISSRYLGAKQKLDKIAKILKDIDGNSSEKILSIVYLLSRQKFLEKLLLELLKKLI